MAELYILNDAFQRIEIVEKFESLIWTERYSEVGDFTLLIDPRIAEQPLAQPGTLLALNGSDRVMELRTVESTTDEEGKRLLKATGSSIESWLHDRPNQSAFASGAAPIEVSKTGTPGDIIRAFFFEICKTNTNIVPDNIQYLEAITISNFTGAIAEPTTSITYRKPMDTLFNTIKELADPWDLGFRLIRVADDSKLYFEVYTGFDRTSGQTARPSVIFSTDLDNLDNTAEVNSNAILKTVAYVYHKNGSRIVYGDGYDVNTTGSARRALIVDANDLDQTLSGAALNTALDLRGKLELASQRYIMGFDGEIAQSNKYIYNTHYRLGDLVEQASDTGYKRVLRVTEQIFVSDKEGDRSYPTLTFNTLITPGTWYAIPGTQEWYDYNSTTYWNSM
jgi:hypothetical protein